MKIAVISDIHANIYALINVLEDIDNEKVDSIICLGDLVGYGPHPNEVVSMIRRRNILCIKGNYDSSVVDNEYSFIRETELNCFSLPWTVSELRQENKYYLCNLPSQISLEAHGKKLLFVHGSPNKINEYLLDHDLSVGICIYSKKTLKECEDLIKPYPFYKGEGFVDKVIKDDAFMREARYFANDNNSMLISENQFNDYVAQTKKNFTSKFMYFLNKSNKSNKDVYKKVHMDRKLFSKILKGESKTPKKNTIIALAFGMELDLHDTEELLNSAGYTLTNSILLDILVTRLLSQGSHDFDYLNKLLAGYGYAAL